MPGLSLDHLERVGEQRGEDGGQTAEDEGRASSHRPATPAAPLSLEQLVEGELDGGVGHEQQRGLGPIPE